MYQAVFELEEEEDIFKMLIKEVNLDDKLDDAKKKARIARIIRETKEVDYNRSIRLEKKLMREIDSLNRKLIARDKQLAKDKIDERRLTLMQQERERARNNIKVMDEELKAVAVNKDELSKQRQAIQQQFKEKAKELKEKKKRIVAERKRESC